MIEIAKSTQPASARQKAYADSLGIRYPEYITKSELSVLLDRATARGDETMEFVVNIEKPIDEKDMSAAEYFARRGR